MDSKLSEEPSQVEKNRCANAGGKDMRSQITSTGIRGSVTMRKESGTVRANTWGTPGVSRLLILMTFNSIFIYAVPCPEDVAPFDLSLWVQFPTDHRIGDYDRELGAPALAY
jgi:hypothetical protein